MGIITKEEFRAICPDSSITDDRLTLLIESFTDYINSLGLYSLEFGKIIEFLKGNDTRKLYLNKRPVKNILTLECNDVEIDSTNYFNDERCVILKNSIFPAGMDIYEPTAGDYSRSGNILVEYEAGFIFPTEKIEGNIPSSLKFAICDLINFYVQDQESQNLSSYKISDISYTFKTYSEKYMPFMAVIESFISV